MTARDRDQLDRDGYLILENCMGQQLLGELRERVAQLFLPEGEQAGSEFKREEQTLRLANLVDKGEVFERAVTMPDQARLNPIVPSITSNEVGDSMA
jgi:hypothetical protein